jgi:hypothetical protein
VTSDNVQYSATGAFPDIRITATDYDDKFLYIVRHDPALEDQLGSLNWPPGLPSPERSFRRSRLIKAGSVESIEDLIALADVTREKDSLIIYKGTLGVDGTTRIPPGDTITFENSRRGISPAIEMRVEAINYLPNRMRLTVNSAPPDILARFRQVQRNLGKVSAAEPLDPSDISHQFYAHGRLEDDTLTTTTDDLRAQLSEGGPGSPRSSHWVDCIVHPGPTWNGYPSKYITALFPTGGEVNLTYKTLGSAAYVVVQEKGPPPGWFAHVPLEHQVWLWSDNAVAVSLWIYHG